MHRGLLHRRRGFTVTEVMVVVGVIILILAMLLPALRGIRSQALMASSMSNLRQVATWMQAYSTDNREVILPSQFDYSPPEFQFKGKVRSQVSLGPTPDPLGDHAGTWADILWSVYRVGRFPAALDYNLGHDYSHQVPDADLYEVMDENVPNVLRSVAKNRRAVLGVPPDSLPKPYNGNSNGAGAREQGLPGFFAANDFFNARPNAPPLPDPQPGGTPTPATGRWYYTGEIRVPDRSMYLVDSFAGYTIEANPGDPNPPAWDNVPVGGVRTIEVDFRYSGVALMLFLDGHVDPVSPWDNLDDLEARAPYIRVRDLTAR